MRKIVALFALLQVLVFPTVTAAQDFGNMRVVETVSWVEEWDAASQSWVRVTDEASAPSQAIATITTTTSQTVNSQVVSQPREASVPQAVQHNAARYAMPLRSKPQGQAIAQYGPFRVIDGKRAAVIGTTDHNSPAQFDAMLRDFPKLEVLDLVDAGGTSHDIANLAVGRRIRAAGIATHVPNGGSARSGGVELFLAGAERTIAPGAQFAVHSWLDNYGREPDDFAPNAPENRLYLDYYVEMGMSEDRASSFYAMTNSVPHSGALWLRADDMAPWIAPEHGPALFAKPEVRIAERAFEAPLPVIEQAPIALAMLTLELPLVETVTLAPSIRYSDLTVFTLARTAFDGVGAS